MAIDYGRFKYVLLRISSLAEPAHSKLVVRGDRRAEYHDNILKATKNSLGDAYKVQHFFPHHTSLADCICCLCSIYASGYDVCSAALQTSDLFVAWIAFVAMSRHDHSWIFIS